MFIESSFTAATLNWLAEKYAVQYKTEAGITEEAKNLPFDTLYESANTDEWKQYSNWNQRQFVLANRMISSGADVICSQEVTPPAIQDLKNYNAFRNAYTPTVFASDDPNNSDPANQDGPAIVTKTNSKLSLINVNVLEFPRIVNNKPSRRVAVTALYETAEKVRVRVTSVHLSGFNPFAQATEESLHKGMDELQTYLRKAEELEKADVEIIAGDFNQDPNKSIEVCENQDRCQFLKGKGFKTAVNKLPTEPHLRRRIDHLLVRVNDPKNCEVQLTNLNAEAIASGSDHRMVALKIDVKKMIQEQAKAA